MRFGNDRGVARTAKLAVIVGVAGFLAACAGPQSKSMVSKPRGKEYFSESEYGVKASPRVTSKRSRLPRGGGRDQVGKPYKVKGKWYYPKEDRNYTKVGAASWYGDAFHGRLTANGEIYDMTHLTAAHPTMPLPSYARVTNTKNGSSVIVRVNDRGPFAHNRVIDLSKRAAELLDYKHSGVAKVKVEYVGRAPLHGQDDRFLMASYRPGKGQAPDPSDGLASGVMVAMAGPTPSVGIGGALMAAAFPGAMTTVPARPAVATTNMLAPPIMPAVADGSGAPDLLLPAIGPIIPERPSVIYVLASATPTEPRLLSYADRRIARAAQAIDAFAGQGMSPRDIVAAWKRREGQTGSDTPSDPYVAVGAYLSRAEADRQAVALADFGRVSVIDEGSSFSVVLAGDGSPSPDELLQLAWENGAPEALMVRD